MLKQNVCLIVFLLSKIRGILSATTSNESLIHPRLKFGVDANISSAKFQVSIRLRLDEEQEYGSGVYCGGSLISDNVVLTAAHCLFKDSKLWYGNANDWVIVMGNLNSFESDEYTLQFNIKRFVGGLFTKNYDLDIALIFLDGAVPKNHRTVKPIILNNGSITTGTTCHTFGWGENESLMYPATLQTVDLPFINYKDCVNQTNYGARVRKGMICAGYLDGGPAACRGDSGGPLVCGGIQAGINSWSKGCGEATKPNVFTDVAYYSKWIEKQVRINGGSPPKFASLEVFM